MRKLCLLLIIGLSSFLSAQEYSSILLSDIHILPSGSDNTVFYTYKIPYNRLVFEKTGNKYSAEFNISIEVFDSSNNFVVRTNSNKKIEAEDFEQTNSRFIYSEGLCRFELKKGNYTVIPLFNDLKSGGEFKLKPYDIIESKKDDKNILDPIIVNSDTVKCGEGALYKVANYEGNIPFSDKESFMIIPVKDTSLSKIHISIVSNRDTLFNNVITDYFTSGISMEECSNNVIIKSSTSAEKTKNFVVKNFSDKLNPGNLVIRVSDNQNSKSEKIFQKSVAWYTKPISLNNYEFALKVLKYIENDSVVSSLLNEDSDNYQQVLFNYWKKYDPNPKTSFNQLMDEFYQRVDFAAMNFRPIDGKSGAETDRGKILIQFGKPQKIERTSNEYGKVIETWVYEKPQRKFIFVDKKGTGDFSLTQG